MRNSSSFCPCGSHQSFSDCCESFLLNQRFPDTPLALMRSRYTAYTKMDILYIHKTMKGLALVGFDMEKTRTWASQVLWSGLKILFAPSVAADAEVGFVEFIASFSQQGRLQTIHERSEFHRYEGRWYYVDSRKPTLRRNDNCPCSSGKKFKNCCLNPISLP